MNTVVLGLVALGVQATPSTVPFKLMESGMQSKFRQGGAFVIRSDAEYRAYLKRRQFESRRPSQLDFRTEQLIAVHIGEEPVAGVGIRVLRVVRKSPTETDVEIALLRPAASTSTEVLVDLTRRKVEPIARPTYPYVVVSTPKFPGTVQVRLVEPAGDRVDA